MKPFVISLFVVELLVITSECNSNSVFEMQRSSFGGANLCQTQNPFLIGKARSLKQCSIICAFSDCKSYSFMRDREECLLFDDVTRYKYEVFENGTCIGYQVKTRCPSSFKTMKEGYKCWRILNRPTRWFDARSYCNGLDGSSHMIILNNTQDFNLAWTYYMFYLKTTNGLIYGPSPSNYRMWSAGISFYEGPRRLPFAWYPYDNSSFLVLNNTMFNPGEPNSPANGDLYCLAFIYSIGGDDSPCIYTYPTYCEIDLD